LYILYGTLKATQEAGDIGKVQADAAKIQAQAALAATQTAQKQLELSERAWVSIEVSTLGPITETSESGGGIQIPLQFLLTDQGTGVAENVSVRSEVLPIEMGMTDAATIGEQHKLCDPLRGGYVPYNLEAVTIFPSRTWVTGAYEIVGWNVIAEALRQFEQLFRLPPESKTDQTQINPVLIGCVNYTYSLAKPRYHQTGFIYDIEAYNPRLPNAAFWISVKHSTTKWRLRRFDIGEAFYAD
jgi:hypothetical protein